jgi:hypothetical protein
MTGAKTRAKINAGVLGQVYPMGVEAKTRDLAVKTRLLRNKKRAQHFVVAHRKSKWMCTIKEN